MADAVTVDELAEAMFRMISDAQGLRKLKPNDVSKAMIEHFGPERCSKEACKEAIRQLVDSGRCIYTYFGRSYIELPRSEDQPQ
jgi:phosphopantothenate synthetase